MSDGPTEMNKFFHWFASIQNCRPDFEGNNQLPIIQQPDPNWFVLPR
jgi:hypothetical protein